MKVIILAGGLGTRLAEYTDLIPKPMVLIGDKPILWHIMNYYSKYNHKDFYIALGYKSEIIKDYFLNYHLINSDFTADLSNGSIEVHDSQKINWRVNLINTGVNTKTGGRLKRLKKYIGKDTCMLTYGDGLSNVDLDKLLKFHKSHGKLVTVTAVHPAARFGELVIEDSIVTHFQEKPQIQSGWINGGYFIFEPGFLDLIEDDNTMLESQPLELASKQNQLMAYLHKGFWQCMDTKRDKDLLDQMWLSNNAPWK